jgi:hypothetical protein
MQSKPKRKDDMSKPDYTAFDAELLSLIRGGEIPQ